MILKVENNPMAKPQVLQAEFLDNKSDELMEILVPVGETVEIFHSQDRFSYKVTSTVQEPTSVVLHPGEWLQLA
jgi:hypothetical protein